MDQEIDFAELWHWLNQNVDWLLSGVFLLLGLNAVFFLYFAWSVVSEPDFFEKYNVSQSASFVAKAKSLREVPELQELEVEPIGVREALPKRYVELKKTNMFVPLANRGRDIEVAEEEAEQPEKKQLPRIEGYEIVGRIAGEGSNRVSVLKRVRDGSTFIAREGERLNNQTDIRVQTVTDTMVKLSQPQHRPTTFQFATDEIKEGIRRYRENVKLH